MSRRSLNQQFQSPLRLSGWGSILVMSPGHLSALVSQTCLLHQITGLRSKRPSSSTPSPHTPDTTEQVQCTICMEDNTMTSHLSHLAKATLPVSVPLKSKRSVSPWSFSRPLLSHRHALQIYGCYAHPGCKDFVTAYLTTIWEKLRGKLCQKSIFSEPSDEVIILTYYFR